MKRINGTIAIKNIMILSGSNEISLVGTVNKNHMSYETQLELDSTQLNLVINLLQRNNPETEISEMFSKQTTGDGNSIFYFDAFEISNTNVDMDFFINKPLLRQIRA